MDKQSMNIFHIISNKEWGGGEQTVLDLSRRQLADGINIELFCLPLESIAERFHELNVPIHTLPLKGVLDFRSAWQMAKIIKQKKNCIVHAHNFKEAFTAAYARKLSGRKDIRVVMCRNLTRKGKTSWIYNWLYGQLDCIVFDSQLAMDTFLSTHPAIDKKKLLVIHNGIVVPTNIVPVDVKTMFSIPKDYVLAMYHGRLNPEKGLDVLIEAVEMLRDKPFRLVLVGRGTDEYTAHLQSLIEEKQLKDKVTLAGFRNPVLSYVAAADIGILPSIVPEGCSLSAQEHLSQGHPIIATNNGGQREYINNGKNGLLVPPNDAKALADAMGQLIDNPTLRKQLGKQAKEDFEGHMTYEHFYAKMSAIYQP